MIPADFASTESLSPRRSRARRHRVATLGAAVTILCAPLLGAGTAPAAHAQEFGAVRIDAGGLSTTGEWSYDVNVSGGYSAHETPVVPADLSHVTDPAPAGVYPSYRFGNSTYTFSYLNPAQDYRLRLHFDEPATWTRVGSRLFDVLVNDQTVLPKYDILAAAGGVHDRAVVEERTVRADATGTLRVAFRDVRGGAIVSGLELSLAGAQVPWPAQSGQGQAGGQGEPGRPQPADEALSRIDVGGAAPADGWAADIGTGEETRTYVTRRPIDVSHVADPAPEAVYRSQREGDTTYRWTGLTPGAPYTMRLHLAETRFRDAGKRVFDVDVNGLTVVKDLDIIARAGARDRAYVETVQVKADATGTISMQTVAQKPQRPGTIAGIEILPGHSLFVPGRTTRVMAVGDSITAGVGSPATGGYRVPLFTAMAARGWNFTTAGANVGPPQAPLQVLNPYTQSRWAGAGGWSMNDIMAVDSKRNTSGVGIESWIKDADPDVILLHIGTNDVIGDWDTEPKLRADFTALMDRIFAAKPTVRVLAATPLQFPGARDNASIAALGRIIPEEAAARNARGQRVDVVPMQDALPDRSYYSDAVHPSRLGYETMAALWMKALIAADRS